MSACSNEDGAFAPFCSPVDGAQFTPGQLVNITWDPSYFGDTSTLVQVSADFTPIAGGTIAASGEQGFTTQELAASTGFFEWKVSPSVLVNDGGAVNAQISIAVASDGTENPVNGPVVQVSSASANSGTSSSTIIVAIVVPVVLGVLALAFVVWYLWMRRRHPAWSLRESLGLSRAGGYGARKSKSERTGPEGGNGFANVRMADIGLRPGDGRNVFREEIRRQENDRV